MKVLKLNTEKTYTYTCAKCFSKLEASPSDGKFYKWKNVHCVTLECPICFLSIEVLADVFKK